VGRYQQDLGEWQLDHGLITDRLCEIPTLLRRRRSHLCQARPDVEIAVASVKINPPSDARWL
jgi:hypothetical protein